MHTSSILNEDGVVTSTPEVASDPDMTNLGAKRSTSVVGSDNEVQTRDGHRQKSPIKSVLLVLTITLAMVVTVANTMMFPVALPTIQKEMHVQDEQLQWIVSAYPLSSGCLLLVFGRLADLYGRKKMFLSGSIILIVFTLGCSFANNIIVLDVLRGLQGVGSAAQIPASLGILAHAFPPSRARSLAFATFSAGAPIGAVFGTVVGGVLTEFTKKTWRSSCYLLTGITVLCFFMAFLTMDPDEPSEETDKRVDWFGAFLVSAGLIQITFVLSQVELAPKKWATPYIIAILILGVLFVIAFFFWQHYLQNMQSKSSSRTSRFTRPPLLQESLWTRVNGRLAAMMVVAFADYAAFLSWLLWVQLYFQNYKTFTPIESVVRLIPAFISGILCNIFIGFMAAKIPIVWILGVGTLSTAAACLLFALIDPNATYWAFCFPAIFIGVLGADFVFAAGSLFIAKYALPHELSAASALFNTMVQFGSAFGVTVTTVVYNSIAKTVISEGKDTIVLYRAAQWTACGFGLLAAIISVAFFRGVGVVGGQGHEVPRERTTIKMGQEGKTESMP